MRIKKSLIALACIASLGSCYLLSSSPKDTSTQPQGSHVIQQAKNFDQFEPTFPIPPNTPYPTNVCRADRPADPKGVILDVPYIMQEVAYVPFYQSNLCWAASLSMITTYLGNPRMPCQIASYQANDGQSCCRLNLSSPASDIERCDQGGDVGPAAGKMGMYYLWVNRALTEQEVRTEISNGHPMILYIEVTRKETDGAVTEPYHAMVVAGYSGRLYRVLNPNRRIPDDLTYEALRDGDQVPILKPNGEKWSWKGTWYHFSYRQDGCNPRYNANCDCLPADAGTPTGH